MADTALSAEMLAATHKAAFQHQRPWSAAEFTSLLASPLIFTCGDSRAFALVRVVADEAELLTLATHPDHQRQGLARALMPLWQQNAQDRGAQAAFLEVAADNDAALALYSQTGFARVGQRPNYYTSPDGRVVDAILMRSTLIG